MSNRGNADPPLPPEKLEQLRKAVKEQLQSLGVNDQIKSLVSEKRNYNPVKGKEPSITREQAIEELKGRGVIEQLVKSLSQSDVVEGGSFTSSRQPLHAVPSVGKRYLRVKVKSGSNFAIGANAAISGTDYLLVCGELFGQRFRSSPVAASVSPVFETSALIELPGAAAADPATLLTHRQPLHLLLLHVQPAPPLRTTASVDTPRMSTSPSSSSSASIGIAQQAQPSWSQQRMSPPNPGAAHIHGHTSSSSNASGAPPGTLVRSAPTAGPAYFLTATSGQHSHEPGPLRAVPCAVDMLRMSSKTGIVGNCLIDWRQALTSKGEAVCHNVHLVSGTHTDPAGMVSVELEVTPALSRAVDDAALRAQTDTEVRQDMEARTDYSGRLKEWWQEYSHDALAQHQEGIMRLTAIGEDCLRRPCCAFVRPLQLGRCLSTPQEAARFVSLLAPKERHSSADDKWSSLHTVVGSGQATQAEKALLLASLLLGFGLDAWVCFGADAVGQQTWVLTRSSKDHVVLWDPSTGTRYNPSSAGQPKGCPLRNIGCAFNQRRLYANLQASDGLAAASYTLEDTGRWRELAVHAQDLIGAPGIRFDLHMQLIDSGAHEMRLESEVKKVLSEHRAESFGHSATHWDDNLAFLLMISLAAYEQNSLMGQPAATNDDFQQSIRRSIPSGFMFKGFPQHHRSLCSSVIVPAMLKETAIRDMLGIQNTDVTFALRVKIFPFPEHVCSVWLMLAVKYSTPKSARVSH